MIDYFCDHALALCIKRTHKLIAVRIGANRVRQRSALRK